MDPLVDAYNATKKGDINGEIMIKSVKDTRIFIIKMGLFTALLMLLPILM